jgi:hypothetical protein
MAAPPHCSGWIPAVRDFIPTTPVLPGIAIALMLVGASSCSGQKSSGEHSNVSGTERILGVIDIPLRDATVKRAVTAGGWALAESGVQSVSIYVDQQFVTLATLGFSRPDVGKKFYDFPNPATSGWGAYVDLSSFANGDHQMKIQVKTKAGHVSDLPPAPFRIQK